MSDVKSGKRTLELDEDMRFQKKEWRTERIGWVLMLLVVLLAGAGLTGRGLFSKRHLESQSLAVEYDAIGRYQAPQELKLHIGPSAGDSDRVHVKLGREFVENVEILGIDPEPNSIRAAADHYEYEFDRTAGDSTLVVIRYESAKMGMLPLSIAVDDGSQHAVREFFLP